MFAGIAIIVIDYVYVFVAVIYGHVMSIYNCASLLKSYFECWLAV